MGLQLSLYAAQVQEEGGKDAKSGDCTYADGKPTQIKKTRTLFCLYICKEIRRRGTLAGASKS